MAPKASGIAAAIGERKTSSRTSSRIGRAISSPRSRGGDRLVLDRPRERGEAGLGGAHGAVDLLRRGSGSVRERCRLTAVCDADVEVGDDQRAARAGAEGLNASRGPRGRGWSPPGCGAARGSTAGLGGRSPPPGRAAGSRTAPLSPKCSRSISLAREEAVPGMLSVVGCEAACRRRCRSPPGRRARSPRRAQRQGPDRGAAGAAGRFAFRGAGVLAPSLREELPVEKPKGIGCGTRARQSSPRSRASRTRRKGGLAGRLEHNGEQHAVILSSGVGRRHEHRLARVGVRAPTTRGHLVSHRLLRSAAKIRSRAPVPSVPCHIRSGTEFVAAPVVDAGKLDPAG